MAQAQAQDRWEFGRVSDQWPQAGLEGEVKLPMALPYQAVQGLHSELQAASTAWPEVPLPDSEVVLAVLGLLFLWHGLYIVAIPQSRAGFHLY